MNTPMNSKFQVQPAAGEWRASGSAGVPPAVPRILRGTPDVCLRANLSRRPGVFREARNTAGGTPALPDARRPIFRPVIFARYCQNLECERKGAAR